MSANRVWNFSPGPATLPTEVLEQVQAELLDWRGKGVSVMEISHRSKDFEDLAEETRQDLRELLALPDDFDIVYSTGGATAHFALIPMNLLLSHEPADYLVTGIWSELCYDEAKRFAAINLAADGKPSHFTTVPPRESWNLNPHSKYFHYVSNETVNGVQLHEMPNVGKPLVIDMSSEFLSKPLNFDHVGMIYAASQKNFGPAGLTVLLVRRDFHSTSNERAPSIFDYAKLAQARSLNNTPPTFIWYISGLIFKWIKKHGGLAAMQKRNQEKAQLLYDYIDGSQLYHCPVDRSYRSIMNVVFDMEDPHMLARFLEEAAMHRLVSLKGHKKRGGVRASIYNAMPLEGVQALLKFMQEFEKCA